jgi:Trk-type K+ transport system membrane component
MYPLALFADSMPSWLEQLLEPQRISLLIPVVAIAGGIGYAIVVAVIRHRERMAKIEQGIDPDAKDEPK